MSRHLLFFLSALLLSAGCSLLKAQELPYDAGNAGRHFVVAFPDTAANSYPARSTQLTSTFQIYVYSAVPNTAQVAFPNGSMKTYTLNPGVFETIDLSDVGGLITRQTGEVTRNAYIIRTEQPVILYCFLSSPFGADAWTPIPVENWGREYVAMTMPGEVISDVRLAGFFIDQSPAKAPAEILVVAAFDGTTVSIDPTGQLEDNARRSVRLDAGDVYQVQSLVDTASNNPDLVQSGLGGTRISSSKPVGVICGNTRTLVHNSPEAISRNSLKNFTCEWLAPIEAHGTEFVYTPTWDSHKQTATQTDPTGVRGAEFAYVVGSSPGITEGIYRDAFSGGEAPFSLQEQTFLARQLSGEARAAYFRTTQPVQIFMAPSPIGKLVERTSSFGQLTKLQYETYGAYMTEIPPVEQWTTFAPFVAPSGPGGLEHYVNVVARNGHRDSIFFSANGSEEQLFIFNRGQVPGTDYVWGTLPITPGITYYLRGYGGNRFGVQVYGTSKGYETYTRIPAKYDERIGVAYGYPAAPNRNVVAPPDSLEITTERECGNLTASVVVLSEPGAGIRSVELASGSRNTEIRDMVPPVDQLTAALGVQFTVAPLDPGADATATVVITDRTGKKTTIPYAYVAERVEITPSLGIALPPVSVGLEGTDSLFVLTNSGSSPVPVTSIELTGQGSGFEILSVTPGLPTGLNPGQSLTVRFRYTPSQRASSDRDTLLFAYGCSSLKRLPLAAETQEPCLSISDADFGVLDPGVEKSSVVVLTNGGPGTLAFIDDGSGIVEGLGNGFSIAPNELTALAARRLKGGEWASIPVTFVSSDSGTAHTALHFKTNSPLCRDSAQLTARVVLPDTVITSVSLDYLESNKLGDRLMANVPNPFREGTTIEFNLGRSGPARLELFDASGHFIATLLKDNLEPGRYRLSWDAVDFSSGIYYIRLTAGNGWTETRRLVLIR